MAEKIKAENPNELNRFIEIKKRLNQILNLIY